MPDICIYFQVHQPYRLPRLNVFDIGGGAPQFDDQLNRTILEKVADKCYRPATSLILDLVRTGDFRCSFSLSGVVVEQLRMWAPDVLDNFRAMAETGAVEFLGETYYHSLSALESKVEFANQVIAHSNVVESEFGVTPRTFRNTELIYWTGLAPAVKELGFDAALVEGADFVLNGRSANHVYEDAATGLALLPRNYRLSDDVGFRFSDRNWTGWPLTAERYAAWIDQTYGETVNLFMDFETLGEHQWRDTGIFNFLNAFPAEARKIGMPFVTPSQLTDRPKAGHLQFDRPTSWADIERDTTAWLGNRIQRSAHGSLYAMLPQILGTGDQRLLADWRRLTTSDHFYYMSTKWFSDGDVHKYFSPFDTPYDAFINFMNILADFRLLVDGNAKAPEQAVAGA